MLIPRFLVWILPVGLMVLGTGAAFGQNYPNKPIRIVTFGVGGGSDFMARLIAQGLSRTLGQQMIVDNRPSGVIPGQIVSRAPPDGYTLLAVGNPLWIGSLIQNTPYDPVRDFSPISQTNRAPNILVVHSSVPANSVKELIALAKARPGALNYAGGSTGSSTHLSGELFNAMAGVKIVRIPYKSGATQMADLVGGHVQLMFGNADNVNPHVKSGKLRALAVTSAEPSVLAPGLPTVAASGLPGYESSSTQGVFAPARTPAVIINRLNQEIVRLLNQADVKETLFNAGLEAVSSTPEQLAATVKSEMARLGKLIKDTGIRAD